jgi:hypothetical protein
MFRVAQLNAAAHFIDDREFISRISEGTATN